MKIIANNIDETDYDFESFEEMNELIEFFIQKTELKTIVEKNNDTFSRVIYKFHDLSFMNEFTTEIHLEFTLDYENGSHPLKRLSISSVHNNMPSFKFFFNYNQVYFYLTSKELNFDLIPF